MVDNTSQSVVNDPNPDATAPAAGSDAQADDLAALLNEYDGAVNKQQTNAADPTPPAPRGDEPPANSVEARLMELERAHLEKLEHEALVETKGAIDGATATIKDVLSELPVKVTDKMIRGYLAETAQENPRFMQAFNDRHRDPGKWDRIVKALGREMASELGSGPDVAATSTRAAVNAAVRASTTQAAAEPQKNFSTMKNHEFEAEVQRLVSGGR